MDLISNLDADYKYFDIKNKLYSEDERFNSDDMRAMKINIETTKPHLSKKSSKKHTKSRKLIKDDEPSISNNLSADFMANQGWNYNFMTEEILNNNEIEERLKKEERKISKKKSTISKNKLEDIDEDFSFLNIDKKKNKFTNEVKKNITINKRERKDVFFKKNQIFLRHKKSKDKINSSIRIVKKIIKTINYVLINNNDKIDILKKNNIYYYKRQNTVLRIKNGNMSVLYNNRNYEINGLTKYLFLINEEIYENVNKNEIKREIDSVLNSGKYNLSTTINFLKENKEYIKENFEQIKNNGSKYLDDNNFLLKKIRENKIIENNYYLKIYNKEENRLSYGYLIKNDILYFFILTNKDLSLRILLLELSFENLTLDSKQ